MLIMNRLALTGVVHDKDSSVFLVGAGGGGR